MDINLDSHVNEQASVDIVNESSIPNKKMCISGNQGNTLSSQQARFI